MKDKVVKFFKDNYSYIIIIIIVLLFRTYIATPIRVNGTSMHPTLKEKEIMILNKIGLTKGIDRFDIVVVKTEEKHLIKRIIAMPGETVTYSEGNLYINGKKMEDKYALSATQDFKVYKLKKDQYFVMGDNRAVSNDSRNLGPISKKDIIGKTSLVIFPFKEIRNVK